MNPAALVLVRGLQAGRSEGELAELLTREYEVPRVVAEADVADFLAQLRNLQLA